MKILAVMILVLSAAVAFSADKVSFPGPQYSTDPTERYLIEWQGPSSEDKLHRLFLKNLRTGERGELQVFDHNADVFWAPDGNAVAITEWGGANVSDITVYFPNRPDVTANMQEVLARSFRKIPFIRENQEVSFEFLGWRSQNTFHFKVWGRGDNNPGGFEKYFEYTLHGKAREIKLGKGK